MKISDSILNSIQIIVNHKVEIAKYDKTIVAQIINCIDEKKGYYRCNYRDAIIYAYSTNLNIIYQKGNYVYILIPENDITKDKLILGFVGNDEKTNSSIPVDISLVVSVDEEQKNLKFNYGV